MLTKTLRDRIGGLLRQGGLDARANGAVHANGAVPANGAALANAAERANGTAHADGPAHANGARANGDAHAGVQTRLFPPAEPRRHFVATGIEEILPGGVIETEDGTVFAHERLYTDLGERPIPLLRRLAELCAYPGCEIEDSEPPPRWVDIPGVDCPYPPIALERNARDPVARARRRPRPRRRSRPRDLPEAVGLYDPPERGLFRRFGYRRVLYLDIETCGLTAAPVFLVGLCMIGERNLVLRQLFARDYAEERALLMELRRVASEHDFLVTYNGKAFDVPFLRDRAVHHRLAPPIDLPHLDLLWMARRRWKGILPDCRLKTIEWSVLRRRRASDVGSSEIPGLYHDYVRRGEAHRLLPVFHHNLLDVVAMVELTPAIFDNDVRVY